MKITEMKGQLRKIKDSIWKEVVVENNNLVEGHRIIGTQGNDKLLSVAWGLWFDDLSDSFQFQANGNIYKVEEITESEARAKVMDRVLWEYSLTDFVDVFGTNVSVDEIVDRKMEDKEELFRMLRGATYCDEVLENSNGYTLISLLDFGNYDLFEFEEKYCEKIIMGDDMKYIFSVLKEIHKDSVVAYEISLEDILTILSLDNKDSFLEDVKNVLEI